MREMDLLLGPFADAKLGELSDAALDRFEALLVENDPDLYRWMTHPAERPPRHDEILTLVLEFYGLVTK